MSVKNREIASDETFADRQRVGQAIKALRKERRLSLEALGAKVGKSVATMSQIEAGGQALAYETLASIARSLGITPAGLVWRAQPKPKNLSPEMDQIYSVFDELIQKLDPAF